MDATYFWTDCTAWEPAPNTAEVGRGVPLAVTICASLLGKTFWDSPIRDDEGGLPEKRPRTKSRLYQEKP